MYVVSVDFTIHSQQMTAFMPLMLENARVSRETEPGCLRFDVCRNSGQPERSFLYEVYADRAAFDEHLATTHFKAFDALAKTMVASKVIHVYELVNT
jgi:quinol monooxygenase YgiN